jgi:hypothetical protein
MNSLKLLAFGNSLAPGRDVVGRFREREDCVLPRFEAAPAGQGGSWWRRLLARFRPETPVPTESCANTPTLPALSAPVEVNALAAEPACGEPVITTPPAVPRATLDQGTETNRLVTARQREFRFEHVTVVCNDLHDADFEFVTLKPAGDARKQPERRRTPVTAGVEI